MNDYKKNCPLEDCPCFVRDIVITNLYPDLKYIYILFWRGSTVLKSNIRSRTLITTIFPMIPSAYSDFRSDEHQL